MKFFRLSFIAAMTMMLAFMSSCSSKDPISQIPEDVDFVSVINIQKVATELGVSITNTDVVLPDEFEALSGSIPEEMNDAIVACNKAIDLSNIAIFGYFKTNDDPELFAIAKVLDKEILDKTLTNDFNFEDEDEEGFEIYTPESEYNKMAILVKDNLAWFVEGKKASAALKSVNKVISRADEKKLINNSGFKSILSENNVCNVLINTTPFIKLIEKFGRYELGSEATLALSSALSQTKGYWLAYTADMNSTGAELTAKFVNADGDVFNPAYVENIDTDYLTFVPDYFQSTIACGINNSATTEIVDAIENMIKQNALGAKAEMMLTMIEKFKDIDGTISTSFGTEVLPKLIFGEKPEVIDFVSTIDMKSGKAVDAIEDIYDALKPIDPEGSIIKKDDIGKLQFVIPEYRTIYIEAWDDQIVIANIDITKGNSNSALKSAVSGAQAAGYIGLNSFADLTDDECKFGANIQTSYKDGEVKCSFEFSNLDGSMISAFTELGMALNSAYKTYRRNNSSSYYYDY